ncbi:MAG: glycosyltransferase, partial [Halieaceae bacterium]|nr:glycosyltransferase [Halieaceae bacterium]
MIAAYNIPKQLRRTLRTLSPQYQGISADMVEVIVIDNGSTPPVPDELKRDFPFVKHIIRVENQPSPVSGLNAGIARATHNTLALMIDGAHMLTPGVYSSMQQVVGQFERPVVNVPQFILGAVSQNLASSPDAFAIEERELRNRGWPENGYSLFEYAVIPGEGQNRDYLHAVESNCLITTKQVLNDSGGFDERFDEPGAGFANLEIFHRLIHEVANTYVALPGEGSFHQDHSGTTTGLSPSQRDAKVMAYREKYESITGEKHPMTLRNPFLFGVATGTARKVPTISHEYGAARDKVLRQLADYYVESAVQGEAVRQPKLVVTKQDSDEHIIRPRLRPLGLLETTAERQGVAAPELGYRNVLKRIHEKIDPTFYFEIGVDNGDSINLAKCERAGVDPTCEITTSLDYPTQIFRQTSDSFFANAARCESVFKRKPELAFIDGMHLAEFVLRDFINLEHWCERNTTILVDDVLPERIEMAERHRAFNAWC